MKLGHTYNNFKIALKTHADSFMVLSIPINKSLTYSKLTEYIHVLSLFAKLIINFSKISIILNEINKP